MVDKVYQFKRGDLIEIPFVLTHQDSNFNWSGVSITSDLKEKSANGPIIYSFSPIVILNDNVAAVLLTSSGTSTTGLNLNKYYGDVVVEKSGELGPYYVFDYQINLVNSVTKPE